MPTSVNFLPLRSKHYPLHSVLAHPPSMISHNLLDGALGDIDYSVLHAGYWSLSFSDLISLGKKQPITLMGG